MAGQSWNTIASLFDQALALEPADRRRFLQHACGADAALFAEVSSLLAAHDAGGAALETSPLGLLEESALRSLAGGLSRGDRVGVYEVVGALGSGGMGEVYEARDTVLGRRVAIKISKRDVAADRVASARFIREAKALATLSHANIAAVYGVETTVCRDGAEYQCLAMVLEFIDGMTLSSRLSLGALPPTEVRRIGRDIATAVAVAHDAGIIHRDLKPANVMLTAAGGVKVLDFGLAKSLGASLESTATLATAVGSVAGTPPYMSPEQVRGESVDRRTDIWAFGCVMFEMLTGRQAFAGGTASECFAAVLGRDPEWSMLPAAAPANLTALLRRCLKKRLEERLRDIGDAGLELREEELASAAANPAPLAAPRWSVIALAVVAGAIAALVLAPLVVPRAATSPVARVELVTPATDQPKSFALSPDGTRVVFSASSERGAKLWLRSLAVSGAQPIEGTEDGTYPFWSPDGRSLGFFAHGALKRADLGSGVRTLAPVVVGLGGSWNDRGDILFAASQSGPVKRVSQDGGPVTDVTVPAPGEIGHIAPVFLPGGRRFVFFALQRAGGDRGVIVLGALGTNDTTRLAPASTSSAVLGSGWILRVLTGTQTLVAQRLADGATALSGPLVVIAEGLATEGASDGVAAISTSGTGLIAYRSMGNLRQMRWADRTGALQEAVGPADPTISDPRVSPDGRWVSFSRTVAGNSDIYITDAVRTRRLTFDPGNDTRAVWSRDGARLAFRSERARPADVYVKMVDGASPEEPLISNERTKNPMSWWVDDDLLLFSMSDPQNGTDLWTARTDQPRTIVPIVTSRARETLGTFSPDGRWLAFQSDAAGIRPEIFVRRFRPSDSVPANVAQWQVSTEGGISPAWSTDGTELFYLNPAGALVAVPMSARGETLEPGAPVVLFQSPVIGGGIDGLQGRQYDVGRDGRFLLNTQAESNAPITLLMHWTPAAPQ